MLKWIIVAILGAGFLLLVLCGVGLYFANSSSQAYQRPVFESIVAEDADAFLDLCEPSLREKVDAPVMLAWMKEINAVMGECKFETGSNFKINFEGSPGQTLVTTSGDMVFANGVANSEFVFQNDQLITFKIEPDKLNDDWFTGPASDALYRERTESFFNKLLEQDFEALKPLMHDSFIEIATDDLWSQAVDRTDTWLGKNATVTITDVDNRISEDEGLIVNALLAGDAGQANASTTIKFEGMRGSILSFAINRVKEPSEEAADEPESESNEDAAVPSES
ncbi:hypothetical protein RISK_002382 [Rhodopirellula islandica]|uniref:Transmembrane protein n=1 Tax=Rhodopirellula islandica TaxID=595434 RepID=A0A0J1BGT3_RHOIS|nr:hypothetical protein [Rhodopirellula islandica]KLU05750.1 hypothetical protein RISK_002382 [Rhodopirellula islandica]